MKSKNKILICILSILILAVNGLTVFYLFPRKDSAKEVSTDNPDFFGTPCEISICKDDHKVTIHPEDEAFEKILRMNEKRTAFTDSFFEDVAATAENTLSIEYCYDEPFSLLLPINLETKSYNTEKICFYLKGSNSTNFSIQTENTEIMIGTLSIDTELIEFSEEILK